MTDLYERSFRDILALAGSTAPTPGGGSIAAMAAALGTSMLQMVARLTLGRKKYQDVAAQVTEVLRRSEALQNQFEMLLSADMEAFDAVMAALRLPAETQEQQRIRQAKQRSATEQATRVPLSLAQACCEGLELALQLAPIGNQRAISDVGVGAQLLGAAAASALLSVDINLPALAESAFARESAAQRDRLRKQADDYVRECMQKVSLRLTE